MTAGQRMRPTDEAELAEAVRAATGPLTIIGGGTRGVAVAGDALDLTGLRGITLHEPGALTLVARAGTPLSEIEAALAAAGQRLAFEPADWRGLLGGAGEPTIGGVIAANISGPRRVQAGAARDACLGLRFVDGRGDILKNGGRVMKNVTGYDLVKLLSGAWGRLGVISEVSLKVLPSPEAEATLILPWDGAERAVAAMSAALSSPFDVTGAAAHPSLGVLVRIEGFAGSVAYRTGRLAEVLEPFGTAREEPDRERSRDLWRRVRDVAPFHGLAGDVWRFSVRPSGAAELAARLGGDVLLDWGGGLLWALLPPGTDARSLGRPYAGHATLVRADAATRRRIERFEPEAPGPARIAAGLRAAFDPRGLFNPGLDGGA